VFLDPGGQVKLDSGCQQGLHLSEGLPGTWGLGWGDLPPRWLTYMAVGRRSRVLATRASP
jgi:hypothetical protein